MVLFISYNSIWVWIGIILMGCKGDKRSIERMRGLRHWNSLKNIRFIFWGEVSYMYKCPRILIVPDSRNYNNLLVNVTKTEAKPKGSLFRLPDQNKTNHYAGNGQDSSLAHPSRAVSATSPLLFHQHPRPFLT